MTNPIAGWYTSPDNASKIRYWDGQAWTHHTNPAPASSAPTNAAVSETSTGSAVVTADARSPLLGRVIVITAVLVVAVVGVSIWAQYLSDERTDVAQASSPEPEPSPSSAQTGAVTRVESANGVVSYEVPNSWVDGTETWLGSFDEASFAGTWNLDGLHSKRTDDYNTLWAYPVLEGDEDLPLEELAQIYYSEWLDTIKVTSDETETFTTAIGYEAWLRSIEGINDRGFELHAKQYLVRGEGVEVVVYFFLYDLPHSYDEQIAAFVDSIIIAPAPAATTQAPAEDPDIA